MAAFSFRLLSFKASFRSPFPYDPHSAFIFLFSPFHCFFPALSPLYIFERKFMLPSFLFWSCFVSSLLSPFPGCPSPFLPFLLCLLPVDIPCKELSGSLDLTRSSLTKRLRKTRYYVLSYTFCNRPSNLVTTVQFKPGLKATKIAPNAN